MQLGMKVKMKFSLSLFGIVALVAVIFVAILWHQSRPTEQEIVAEQIIRSFMIAKGIDFHLNSQEYKIFMRRIVWGEYPELTGEASVFVNTQYELDSVNDYAWKYSGYEELYGGFDEPNIKEAKPLLTDEPND